METPRGMEAHRRVTADQWDVDAWNMMANEATHSTYALAKPLYDRLTVQFPPVSKFWRSYTEHLLSNDPDQDEVVHLYNRALAHTPTSIELWQAYISYMIQLQQKNPGLMEAKVVDIIERAIATAGLDLKADIIWTQYINFVARQAAMTDDQRKDDLRRIYQRAVCYTHPYLTPPLDFTNSSFYSSFSVSWLLLFLSFILSSPSSTSQLLFHKQPHPLLHSQHNLQRHRRPRQRRQQQLNYRDTVHLLDSNLMDLSGNCKNKFSTRTLSISCQRTLLCS